jgi:hypothetical protein
MLVPVGLVSLLVAAATLRVIHSRLSLRLRVATVGAVLALGWAVTALFIEVCQAALGAALSSPGVQYGFIGQPRAIAVPCVAAFIVVLVEGLVAFREASFDELMAILRRLTLQLARTARARTSSTPRDPASEGCSSTNQVLTGESSTRRCGFGRNPAKWELMPSSMHVFSAYCAPAVLQQ